MSMLEKRENVRGRCLLVGLACDSTADFENSDEITMAELAELVKTAGGETVMTAMQNKHTPDPHTFIGEGKAAELKELIAANEIDLTIVDNELSPSQSRALEEALSCRVIDRSGLILDIFADRARTAEGKLQVELAQYQYLLPRLTGMWTHLVRQTASGGSSPIGTRGPGETQLETDRRHIRRKIQRLQEDIRDLQRVRATQRSKREKNEIPLICIVGYTNAGKSTLLNALTGAEVHAADRLFDTLDPTTRLLHTQQMGDLLFSDTVGFIRKLPHHLIQAFRSTLEEAKYADYLIHVVDASNPQRDKQMHIVYDTLYQLEIQDKTILTLFNKQDLVTDKEPLHDFKADATFAVSARTGEGLDAVKEKLSDLLRENKILIERVIPYADAGIIQQVRKGGELLTEEYRAEGIYIKAYVPMELYGRLG